MEIRYIYILGYNSTPTHYVKNSGFIFDSKLH